MTLKFESDKYLLVLCDLKMNVECLRTDNDFDKLSSNSDFFSTVLKKMVLILQAHMSHILATGFGGYDTTMVYRFRPEQIFLLILVFTLNGPTWSQIYLIFSNKSRASVIT